MAKPMNESGLELQRAWSKGLGQPEANAQERFRRWRQRTVFKGIGQFESGLYHIESPHKYRICFKTEI